MDKIRKESESKKHVRDERYVCLSLCDSVCQSCFSNFSLAESIKTSNHGVFLMGFFVSHTVSGPLYPLDVTNNLFLF